MEIETHISGRVEMWQSKEISVISFLIRHLVIFHVTHSG